MPHGTHFLGREILGLVSLIRNFIFFYLATCHNDKFDKHKIGHIMNFSQISAVCETTKSINSTNENVRGSSLFWGDAKKLSKLQLSCLHQSRGARSQTAAREEEGTHTQWVKTRGSGFFLFLKLPLLVFFSTVQWGSGALFSTGRCCQEAAWLLEPWEPWPRTWAPAPCFAPRPTLQGTPDSR